MTCVAGVEGSEDVLALWSEARRRMRGVETTAGRMLTLDLSWSQSVQATWCSRVGRESAVLWRRRLRNVSHHGLVLRRSRHFQVRTVVAS